MGRNRKTYNIRLQVTVDEGSPEDILLEVLNDEQTRPFGKAQMMMMALKPFWMSWALSQRELPSERVLQALQDSRYLWELHEQYLRERIGELKLGSRQMQVRGDREDTNPVTSPFPKSKAQKDSEQIVRTDSNGVLQKSGEAKPLVAEVVEDKPAVIEESKKPFNPFGESVVIRS